MDDIRDTETQEMVERLTLMTSTIAHNDALFDAVALVYRKTYDALVRQGFDPSQALEIVARQGVASKTN